MNFDIFLNKESTYNMINRPHRTCFHTFYSDGHYIIRVKNKKPGRDPISISHYMWAALKKLPSINGTHYKSLPQYAAPEVNCCQDCAGTGYVEDCPECDAQGCVELKNEHNVYYPECQTCNGSGKCIYWGDDNADQLLEIGGHLFNKNLLEKLKLLPLFAIQSKNPEKEILQFSFFGGKGLLMGIDKKKLEKGHK